MDLPEPTSTMQVLSDENLLAIIMDNVANPQTLFNLVMVLPTAKASFERCPRQFLTATLSGLPSELEQLAILYIALIQDYHTRASMVPLLRDYLRLDDTLSFMFILPEAATDITISTNLCNPFETLRKLAAVWNAVEDLATGFVEHSLKFIQNCKAPQAAGLEIEHYDRGRKFRPLSHLWNRQVTLRGLPGYETLEKPQPWSLPLRASEIHRVKRALWRLEIFAALSHEPHTFPNESAVELGAAERHRVDAIETWAMPQDYDEGTRILLASLHGFELAELESVYDYLWCKTIEKAYQHKIDAYMAHYDEKVQQARAERNAGTTSHDVEQWEQDQATFQARFARQRKLERFTKDHDRYLTYYMSLGLPFLHRVHQQITLDGDEIVPENYPPLRYRSLTGLRDTRNSVDKSRCVWPFYSFGLMYIKGDGGINSQLAVLRVPEKSPGVRRSNACAEYLKTRTADDFRVEDVWRAGCYMWEG